MTFLKHINPSLLFVRNGLMLRSLSVNELQSVMNYQAGKKYNKGLLKNPHKFPYFTYSKQNYDIFYYQYTVLYDDDLTE